MWPNHLHLKTYERHTLSNLVLLTCFPLLLWLCLDKYPSIALGLPVGTAIIVTLFTIWRLKANASVPATEGSRTSPNKQQRFQARWAYSSLATTTILILAAIPAGTFLTIGFHRSLSLYESFSVHNFTEQISERRDQALVWQRHILPPKRFNSLQGTVSGESHGEDSFMPVHYPDFLAGFCPDFTDT